MNELSSFKYNYSVFSISQPFKSDDVIDIIKNYKHDSVYLQILDPTNLVGDKQIKSALFQAERAFKNKKNIARDYSTEFLVRLAGKRQISNAIELLGIKDTCENIMFIAFGIQTEDVEQEFSSFLDSISARIDLKDQKKLPISNIEDLALYYKCEENLETIEKKAIELIATVEIL